MSCYEIVMCSEHGLYENQILPQIERHSSGMVVETSKDCRGAVSELQCNMGTGTHILIFITRPYELK